MGNALHPSVGQTPHVDGRRSEPGRAFGWILTLGSVALLLLGADEARRVLPALTWPSAAGRVESARISFDTVATSVGRWRNSPVVEPRLHLTYGYRVDGREYVGRQLDLLPISRRNTRADLQRYPAGAAVSVHYNPEHPADAVLEAPWPVRAGLTAVIGVVLLLLGRRLSRKRAAS